MGSLLINRVFLTPLQTVLPLMTEFSVFMPLQDITPGSG